jgi:hypothetical protein
MSLNTLGDSEGGGASPSRPRLVTVLGIAGIVTLLAILAFSLAELFSAGGHDGSELQSISGTISFKGRPIALGVVEFVPQMIESDQRDFTPGWAEIRDGAFAHKGLGCGTYLLRIGSEFVETHRTWLDEKPMPEDPAPGRPCERSAPVIEVKPDGPNHFNVRLK